MANKTLEVLEILSKLAVPAAISDIKAELGNDISDRTLHRQLMKLVEKGEVIASGEKRGRLYRLPAPSSNAPQTNQFLFSTDAAFAIESVRQPLITREPCTYHSEWLNEYIPNKTFYLSSEQRQQLLSQGQQISAQLPAGTYAHHLFNRLLIDLSYNSSRLEGNTYSLPDTEKLLLDGEIVDGKLDEEKIMLLNHKEAIRLLVEGINRLEVSIDNVRSLHYLLADGLVASGAAGQIRSDMVRVSLSTYIPITGRERLEQQLRLITQTAREIENPFEQSFFLLVHISYLQAFIDVNKRTARLACNIPLVRHNLVPLSFNDIDKDDYASAMLVVYEQNKVEPLAELYGWSYLRSCKHYQVTARSLGIDPLRVQYRQLRRGIIRYIVQNNLHNEELDNYLKIQIETDVPTQHQTKFLEDMHLDLEQLAPHSIAGMGITRQELEQWLQNR